MESRFASELGEISRFLYAPFLLWAVEYLVPVYSSAVQTEWGILKIIALSAQPHRVKTFKNNSKMIPEPVFQAVREKFKMFPGSWRASWMIGLNHSEGHERTRFEALMT